MDKVKRTLDQQTPFIVFVTHVLGGISLGVGAYFGQPWLVVGMTIFGVCTSFSMISARNAKEQYNELLEQLKKVAS